jgi:hypothetical protein
VKLKQEIKKSARGRVEEEAAPARVQIVLVNPITSAQEEDPIQPAGEGRCRPKKQQAIRDIVRTTKKLRPKAAIGRDEDQSDGETE